MSGPKVVRVVTREEAIAECQGHLARLDTAIQLWKEEGQAAQVLDEQDIQTVLQRYEDYARRLEKDEFLTISTTVPKEIEFLKADIVQRKERAIERERIRKAQRKNLPANASALLKALQNKVPAVPPAVLGSLEKVLKDQCSDEEADRILSEALNHLADPAASTMLSAEQQALATRLRGGGAGDSLQAWMAPKSSDDPRGVKLQTMLQSIESLGDERLAVLKEKFEGLAQEKEASRRNMLTDSLILEVSGVLKDIKAAKECLFELRLIQSELSSVDTADALKLSGDIAQVISCQDAVMASTLAEQARTYLRQLQQQRAALARRQAVLQGLSALGYEVREGMATAWVDQGRVTLKSLSNPGYGLELAGAAEQERMQVRVVAYASADRNPARDTDAEQLWCGDFQRLQSALTQSGGALTLEKAMEAGKTPLKVIESEGETSSHHVAMTPRQTLNGQS